MTTFTAERLHLYGDLSIYLDGNSKITGSNGSYDDPAANAFSLPHISTCPGSTQACRSACYVHGLSERERDLYRLYRLNEMALHRILISERSSRRAAEALGYHIERRCLGGFRWHVSGDVISDRHAGWIVDVCKRSPSVTHWIYTRSLWCAPELLGATNLVVNVSADEDNFEDAREVVRGYPEIRLCYLTRNGAIPPDLPRDSIIFPDYSLRGRDLAKPTDAAWWQDLGPRERKQVCPADFFGQSESIRCGHERCSKCLKRRQVQ